MIRSACFLRALIATLIKLGDRFWARNHYPLFIKFSPKFDVRSPKDELCYSILSLVQAKNLKVKPLYPKGLTPKGIGEINYGVRIARNFMVDHQIGGKNLV